MLSGAVAGLVAVTPASGYAGPMGSIVLGLVAGAVCYAFCSSVKNAVGYDDSLDVFGIHFVGGVLGALATGILVSPALGGVGLPDYEAKPGELAIGAYAFGPAMLAQVKAVALTIAWSGIGSAVLYKLVDLTVGLRVTQDEEREGLDLADHGERAYNY
jgi:Amt family ammonium transporter